MDLFIDPRRIAALAGDHPAQFPTLVAELAKSGAKWLAKDVFGAKATPATLAAHYRLLGRDAFVNALDTLADKSLPAIAKRIDKHAPAVKALSGRDCRKHVLGIAAGDVVPTEPLPRKATAKRGGVAFKSPFANPSLLGDDAPPAASRSRPGVRRR